VYRVQAKPFRQSPRYGLDRFDRRSRSRRVPRHQGREEKHQFDHASAPDPRNAKRGWSAVAKVQRVAHAVDFSCAAHRLAIVVCRTSERPAERSPPMAFTSWDRHKTGKQLPLAPNPYLSACRVPQLRGRLANMDGRGNVHPRIYMIVPLN
jgi:hypothetical protein